MLREALVRILSLQRPTKERLPYYDKIWENHDYSNIVDIGSGLNPLSIALVNKKVRHYLALEIDYDIVKFLNEASTLLEIPIRAEQYNFLEIKDLEGEIALLWKVVPIMYKLKGHGFVLSYLSSLKRGFNYLSLSFPRRSLGKGKPIGRAWKGYVRKIAEKLELKIMKEFEIPTEYFVILEV